jgi:hypothetical protein
VRYRHNVAVGADREGDGGKRRRHVRCVAVSHKDRVLILGRPEISARIKDAQRHSPGDLLTHHVDVGAVQEAPETYNWVVGERGSIQKNYLIINPIPVGVAW